VMIKDLQRQVGISIKFQYFKVILCLLLWGDYVFLFPNRYFIFS
jgi:hypothetical protein